jgi:hypothetical protein
MLILTYFGNSVACRASEIDGREMKQLLSSLELSRIRTICCATRLTFVRASISQAYYENGTTIE